MITGIPAGKMRPELVSMVLYNVDRKNRYRQLRLQLDLAKSTHNSDYGQASGIRQKMHELYPDCFSPDIQWQNGRWYDRTIRDRATAMPTCFSI